MLRASAVCEAAGYPTASLVCEGFLGQAATTSVGLGMPNIPCALVPGHVGAQSKEELRRNILEVTTQRVIDKLTQAPEPKGAAGEPGARDVIFKGGFKAVNRYFYENELPTACRSCRRRARTSRVFCATPTAIPTNRSARCCPTAARRRSGASR